MLQNAFFCVKAVCVKLKASFKKKKWGITQPLHYELCTNSEDTGPTELTTSLWMR